MSESSAPQRKEPKQARSRAIVDAIFEATVRLLPKVGSEQLTTRKVAELAGVSIGSLYQYFPNKDALINAIMNMVISVQLKVVRARLDEVKGKSLEESVQILVRMSLEQMLNEREKMRELFRRVEPSRLTSLLEFHRECISKMAQELERHRPGLKSETYARMGFVAFCSTMGVVEKMILDPTQNYSIEELSRELEVLILSYINAITTQK